MPFPLTVFQRHPRYALALAAVVLTAFWYLSPYEAAPSLYHPPLDTTGLPRDPDLRNRIARSERIYQRTIEQRQELIKKWGPTPTDIVMFPPDHEPWPAYTVWDFFPPTFTCPHELERVGNLGDGGKWTCGLSRIEEKQDCVIYVFGVDWDSSWEAEMLSRTRHCQIYGYDYSANGFGSFVPRTAAARARTHFEKATLGPSDSHGPEDSPKMWTLRSLMRENGHSHIDILKVDVEGWEFEVMRSMVRDFISPTEDGTFGALPFGQLQMEFHVWHRRFDDFLSWFQLLEEAGLRPFMAEVNLVYANYNRQSGVELINYFFLNTKGDNVFISDGKSTIAQEVLAKDDGRIPGAEADEPDIRFIRHGPGPDAA
ncbi:hypothetical protein CERSUDRAFT_87731 [Gelatoporia subvermispora B]|uniref:Methyltransferase domain-containing protein n=1 Tax=Ceriporiopsis subvermispora (strain B) TaxID=914234 RepID=M2Q786_CERS8|nr:hypothetical protein CERSUDRAFT_87731 [Gelatoporia subvermispora B]